MVHDILSFDNMLSESKELDREHLVGVALFPLSFLPSKKSKYLYKYVFIFMQKLVHDNLFATLVVYTVLL